MSPAGTGTSYPDYETCYIVPLLSIATTTVAFASTRIGDKRKEWEEEQKRREEEWQTGELVGKGHDEMDEDMPPLPSGGSGVKVVRRGKS